MILKSLFIATRTSGWRGNNSLPLPCYDSAAGGSPKSLSSTNEEQIKPVNSTSTDSYLFLSVEIRITRNPIVATNDMKYKTALALIIKIRFQFRVAGNNHPMISS